MINWKSVYREENEKKRRNELLNPDVIYQVGVQPDVFIPMVKKHMVPKQLQARVSKVLRCRDDFQRLYQELITLKNFEDFLEELLKEQGEYYYPCYCEVCGKIEKMIVENSAGQSCNWREGIICPECGLGNHKRFWIGKVRHEYRPGMKVLALETDSPVYRYMEHDIPDVQGIVPAPEGSGSFQKFADNTFSLIAANDVFEKVIDFENLLNELARITKKEGKLIFTTVFNANSDESHDNVFGWDLLNGLKRYGFSDAYAVADFSINDGYLGYLQFYFEAVK